MDRLAASDMFGAKDKSSVMRKALRQSHLELESDNLFPHQGEVPAQAVYRVHNQADAQTPFGFLWLNLKSAVSVLCQEWRRC